MDKATLIEKIKKCMALGGSCEPHEASEAIKKAQILMDKYNITADDVALSAVKENITQVNDTLKAPTYLRYLVSMISTAFGCDTIYHPKYNTINKKEVSVSFIGFDPNPELATYTFEVLRRQLVEGRTAYIKSLHKGCKKATKTRRANLWAEYWVLAANTKVSKLTLTQEQSSTLDLWTQQNYKALSTIKSKATAEKDKGDLKAMFQGHRAGKKVSLHSPVYGRETGQLSIGHPGAC